LDLSKEIKSLETSIRTINDLSLDDRVKEAHLDRLQASLAYYYQQSYNHEQAILRDATNTPLNDEDMTKVHKDLNHLKSKI
jgi:hypothetical protein